ncbi:Trans-enoyl reductase [Lachnellula occidentalis]|uniref:Trans-enoyl reductase n=1 Tax=Lachnellula occidentalis TaxID=215460 RepID=A0A8H8RT69_9HELO|nr:Trans-enoyl reductase [Lachnellula occidentalis]
MKELFLTGGPIRGEIREVEIPVPKDDEVLIKVIATDSNPKDWKTAKANEWLNQGDDISGIIYSTGSSVTEFHAGDRVAALHRMWDPHGAHAEFAIAPASTTFRLPPNISFEEGTTIPLCAMTAALALYQHLRIPPPWNPVPKGTRFPVLVYGGASAVGAFALKFAKLSNCNPIITVAGEGIPFVRSLNAADIIVDYRCGGVVAEIKNALKGQEVLHVFDPISNKDSWEHILAVIPLDGHRAHINSINPPKGVSPWPPVEMKEVKCSQTFISTAYGRLSPWGTDRTLDEVAYDREFAYVMYRYISLLLEKGKLTSHPFDVLGGLEAVERGTTLLSERAVSSKKLVYRISDTPGT